MSASGMLREVRLRVSARRRAARPDTLTARVAGALLIAATVASLLSTALLNPVSPVLTICSRSPHIRTGSSRANFSRSLHPDATVNLPRITMPGSVTGRCCAQGASARNAGGPMRLAAFGEHPGLRECSGVYGAQTAPASPDHPG
jgi:hypothetical protein